jgi:SAM-dependent methyltransferase
MSLDLYYRRMLEYYDGAKHRYDDASLRKYAREGLHPFLQPIVEEARRVFAETRVMDLACGVGNWCRALAPSVKTILGVDLSEKLLEIAREATDAGNVSYFCDDAMTLHRVQGEFDGCFHFNFFNHVPHADWLRFLDRLHARLGAGKLVMMGAQKLLAARKKEILTWTDEVNDPVQANPRGETNYYIVENTFDEALVCVVMQGRAVDLKYMELPSPDGKCAAWYATYRVP